MFLAPLLAALLTAQHALAETPSEEAPAGAAVARESRPALDVDASTAAAAEEADSAGAPGDDETPEPAAADPAAARARALYFSADVLKAAEAFEAASKRSPGDWRLWSDGAVAWAESGRPDKAIAWAKKAAELHPAAPTRASYGWTLLRAGEAEAADAEFGAALQLDPRSAWALLGAGRAKLALGKPKEAVVLLKKAADAAPGQSLADYYLGMAHDALGESSEASEAYRRAVGADSYFNEGRGVLARSYLRLKRYNEAWRQLQKLVDADPGSKLARAMLETVRPLLTRSAEPSPPSGPAAAAPAQAAHETEAWGKAPVPLRVGISSTALGKPRPRKSATVRGSGHWKALDAKTGKLITRADAGDAWTIAIAVPPSKGKKKKKGRSRLELRGPDGRPYPAPGDAVRLVPDELGPTTLTIEDDTRGSRAFRGELELAMTGGRRVLRVVNVLGLEDYTHGVVSSEMPQRAPLEALKAQAVVARTHALYIRLVTRRHRKEGYDVCDEQHCQMYNGLRAETERTRAVVRDTRGRIAAYDGRPAHVIYCSHCGGHTQSGTDIGWGRVPYWTGVPDAADEAPTPAGPVELRRYLSDWPKGFDRPSSYVHASHARWTRAIPAKELEAKLDRKLKVGKLKGLRVVRRAPSGHVNAILVTGSRKTVKVKDELSIRGLLGVGSLRSTLFVLDVEYKKEASKAKVPKGKKAPPPTLVPETYVFRGGGWGHAIGLCQSGAMGRAEAGQDYERIVKAYFKGVELRSLQY